jgi:hypothetical protein
MELKAGFDPSFQDMYEARKGIQEKVREVTKYESLCYK